MYIHFLIGVYIHNIAGIRAVEPTSQPGVAIMQVDGLQSRVCSRQWDNNDAAVYCRSLGYGFGRAFGTTYGTSSLPLLVSNITCRGDEASITACPFTTGTATSCGTYETARVFCYNREQGEGYLLLIFLLLLLLLLFQPPRWPSG